MALGYTDYEEGFRHGKRDFACGIRFLALLEETSEYASGYRAGLAESETIYCAWLEAETEAHALAEVKAAGWRYV